MGIHHTFQSLRFETWNFMFVWALSARVSGQGPALKEENMKKLALATAAVAALALSVPAFTAPALAQDVKVKIKSGDRHHDGWRHRNVSKKVIIKHGDRGRHEGWRHSHHYGAVKKKVIIRHGHGGGSKTVIKKREG